MDTLNFSEPIKNILSATEGDSVEEKVLNLLWSDLSRRLDHCVSRILEFEKKHGINFDEFQKLWEVKMQKTHENERDYMEWESLVDEYHVLLPQIKVVREMLLKNT